MSQGVDFGIKRSKLKVTVQDCLHNDNSVFKLHISITHNSTKSFVLVCQKVSNQGNESNFFTNLFIEANPILN